MHRAAQEAGSGALDGSLSMVRAFLENRKMTITLDGHREEPVDIQRGSPQGSILGCLLYCVTTQTLTKDLRRGRTNRYFPQTS